MTTFEKFQWSCRGAFLVGIGTYIATHNAMAYYVAGCAIGMSIGVGLAITNKWK